MKIKKIFIKTILGITTVLSLYKLKETFTIDPNSISYNANYSEEDCLYASYGNIKVYISDDKDKLNSGISILDLRSECDDIKIFSSSEIKDFKSKVYIIKIILDYNSKYPSNTNWQRSESSLLNEWYVHNILYDFGLYQERTKDVDFETSEEDKYKVFTIK